MDKYPYRQDKEEMKELLRNFENLKNGRSHSFIEEDGFERIVDYFDEKEQYAQALEAAEMAVEQFSFSSQLLLKKAAILLTLRRYEDALIVLDKSNVLDASDINLYILQTDAYLALDMQQKAASLLEEAIHKFEGEERIELLFELADVYDDYEDFEKVFDCLKIILGQDPVNEEALYKICFWTDFTGRNEEGIQIHKEILEEYPYNELAWFNLGAAYQGLKLYEKAIDAYLYAVAINEKFDYAYRNMGDAYIRLRNYKDAIDVLEKVLELTRPEAVIYEAIGHCYDKQQNFAQARFNYKKASHLSPEEGSLHFKIASTYMNEGNWKVAIKNLDNAIKLNKLQPEYNLAKGRCFLELGNIEEALTQFGNVVRMRPRNINGWVELLRTFHVAGMHEEGLEYAGFALEQTEGKPIFRYYISMFLFETGKTKEGLIQLENAIQVNPKQVKKFIEINPSILQHPQVVDLLARNKKKK